MKALIQTKPRKCNPFAHFNGSFSGKVTRSQNAKKEGLCFTKSSQQFYFAHVLETLRHLRDMYFDSKGIAKARHLHDFVLLALYVRANPGRSKEIRTLQLYLESEKNEPFISTNLKAEFHRVRTGSKRRLLSAI